MKAAPFLSGHIHYQSLGNKEPVLVLVHGFCEDGRVWRLQQDELAKTCRVLVPDLPGFGQTPLHTGEYSLERMAEAVKAMLDQEMITTCTLVGHSMGGYMALAFAELFPDRLNGFGLFHSTALADPTEKKANRLKAADFIRQNGAEAFVKTLTPGLFAPTFSDHATVHELTEMGNACMAVALAAATMAMYHRPDRTHVLAQSRVPVLFAVGQHDLNVPKDTLLPQCSLPSASLVELFEHSAHMGMREQPNKALNLLGKFVKLCNG